MMNLFFIALILLMGIILMVSLAYIVITTRHKEKMILLEKGLDPNEYINVKFLPNALRAGLIFIGAGLGFLLAFVFDEFLMKDNENPAIYPGLVLVFGGLGQVLFYYLMSKKK